MRTVEEIIETHDGDYIPFYGGFMSQWFPSPFRYGPTLFPTAEHFMMAMKAKLFDDFPAQMAIMSNSDPAAAKALGRRVKGFDPRIWDVVKVATVFAGNWLKFTQHPDLRKELLSTGKAVLVEASPTDRIWGIGMAADDHRVRKPWLWRGSNLLGFVLMEVRDRI